MSLSLSGNRQRKTFVKWLKKCCAYGICCCILLQIKLLLQKLLCNKRNDNWRRLILISRMYFKITFWLIIDNHNHILFFFVLAIMKYQIYFSMQSFDMISLTSIGLQIKDDNCGLIFHFHVRPLQLGTVSIYVINVKLPSKIKYLEISFAHKLFSIYVQSLWYFAKNISAIRPFLLQNLKMISLGSHGQNIKNGQQKRMLWTK